MPPRQLFFYEAPDDGGGEPPVDPDVVDQPTGDAAGDAEEQAWSVSQDDWNRTQQYLQATAPIIEQAAQLLQAQQQAAQQGMQQYGVPEQQAEAMPEFDPWDPASVQAYINASIQQGMQQNMGPYQQMFNTLAESEGEKLARAQMDRLSEEVGSFDQDATYMIAAGALADENLNPDVVLSSAARYMHDFEERIRADEREKYAAEMNGLSGRPADSPVGASAGREDETVPRGPRRYHEAVERALARRNPGMPIG